jgi:hypothetical protein
MLGFVAPGREVSRNTQLRRLEYCTSKAVSPFAAFKGEPGSEAASLISEKLLLRPSAPLLLPLRWLNLTPRRGFAIATFCSYWE